MARQVDKEILDGFVEEIMGYIPTMRQGIEGYLADKTQLERLEQAHRLAHTIKGASSMVGLSGLSHLAYYIEETLGEIATGRRVLDQELSLLLCTALQEIEVHLNDLAGDTTGEPGFSEMISRFRRLHKPLEEEGGMAAHGMSDEATEISPMTEDAFEAGDTKQSPILIPSAEKESSEEAFYLDPEMLEVFSIEAEDHLRSISSGLAVLEKQPENQEILQEVRRSVHTLKGAAGVVGLRALTQLSHRMEDLLDYLYENQIAVSPDMMGLLLASTDVLERLADGDEKSVQDIIEDLYASYTTLLHQLSSAVRSAQDGLAPKPGPLPQEKLLDLAEFTQQPPPPAETETVEEAAPTPKRAVGRVVRVPIERLDDLVKLVSELVISRTVIEQRMADLGREVENLQQSADRLRRASGKLETEYEAGSLGGSRLSMRTRVATSGASIPGIVSFNTHGFDDLEFDRYTEFHRLSRELAETSGDINATGLELSNLLGDFDSILNRQRRLSSEIQDGLMRVRMVPLATLVARLQRTVRVAASHEGKLVDLFIEGQNIELDTTVLDQMVDPLLHLLRNAVSHGIETPARRAAHSKRERGTIRLRSFYEGTQVVIEVSDDGAGLDPEVIRSKALSRGHISSADAGRMSEKELFSLIFLPGFSTAKELSEVSGRGVGMDIVKASINKLQGTLALDSTPGKGTTITIRLPTTLAVARALLIKAHGETFAVPLGAVTQIIRVERGEIEHLAQDAVIRAGGRVYPVIRLGEALRLKQPADEAVERLPVLILKVGGDHFALVVEQVIEGREIVIKSLGNHLRRVHGIMGATLMGDGRVVPILQPADLVRNSAPSTVPTRPLAQPPATGITETLTVMVVDDSPSVRRVMSNLLKSVGWQPVAAKDGLQALEMLHGSPEQPTVILLDVEMPRMDGYELLAALKRQEAYRMIPVVMITSRTGEKHRRKAIDLGASEYLSKPYQDEELLNIIRRLAK